MTKIAITYAGVDASGYGYNQVRSCPTYGAGYAAYMFGTSLNSAPTQNLFTGSNDGRLVGATDAVGLTAGPIATSTSATVTGGNLLTVAGTVTGDPWAVGMTVELTTGVGGSLGTIASLGTGTGGAGTYNLVNATNGSGAMRGFTRFFEVPGFSRDIFNIGSAVTLLAIYKSPLTQCIISDDFTGGLMSMMVPAAYDVQTFGRDAASVVVNVATSSGFTNGATTWSMGVSQFNLTTAQGFIQRSGPARVASTLATTRTSNPMGNTARKLRTGYTNSSTTPSSSVAGLAIYTKQLSSGEMDDAFLFWKSIMSDVGQVL